MSKRRKFSAEFKIEAVQMASMQDMTPWQFVRGPVR